ncbi:MAG: extracellular solute-binding protein, partial [Lachnospiraceae bacterium]|nr:extracellular solute-binding protein [Lachnospiraceae bacterium]
MKKRNLQRIFAAFMATAMVVGVTACGTTDDKKDTNPTDAPVNQGGSDTTPEPTKPDDGGSGSGTVTTPEPTPTEVAVPADLKDLGGMEIIIRDWWSPEDPGEPKTEYEEAQRAYQKEMMDKYNFTIRSMAISDWGSAPNDFVEYATNGGDDKNYVFVLRNDPAVVSAMASGLMYDLSKMPDVLDFSSEKFAQNRTHELYSYGSSIYCCFAGPAEPRDGIFFNKSVLKEAGINPDDIYDMQKNNTWTWEEFEKLLAKVQRDTDGDGQDDVFGLCCNNSVCVNAAVISNGGKYVGKDASGKFTYNLEDPETTEALNWIVDIFTKYNQHDIEGAAWNY